MKMTALLILAIGLLFVSTILDANAGGAFDQYFVDKTMRVDYHHIADSKTEIITLDRIYQYGIWSGSFKNMVDNLNNGRFYVKVYDAESGKLIFSRGFDSYCGEYQLSGPAAKGIKKTYHETAIIPYPKKKIKFAIDKRDRKQQLNEIFSCVIDPADVNIVCDAVKDKDVKVVKSHYSGDPHKKVDLAFIAEGYAAGDEAKFNADLKRFTKIFLEYEPYCSYKDRFNIYGVFKPAEDSGIDEPRAGLFKNTPVNATFNSMGSERYLLTEDNKALRDLAAHVPYDALLIMANHKRYGGGGIYNFYCTFTTDNQFHAYLLLHEFGHSFSGLADEYYTSSTAYNDFYPRGLEPVEANITALLDPKNLKWKEIATTGIEVPTPWEKAEFDKNDALWQKKRAKMNQHIADLKRKKAPKEEILKAEKDYAEKDKAHSAKVEKYLRASKFWGKIGAFEGAGYSSEGLYRPELDCIMFSKGHKPHCKVCEAQIIKIIKHHSE